MRRPRRANPIGFLSTILSGRATREIPHEKDNCREIAISQVARFWCKQPFYLHRARGRLCKTLVCLNYPRLQSRFYGAAVSRYDAWVSYACQVRVDAATATPLASCRVNLERSQDRPTARASGEVALVFGDAQ